MGVFEEGLNDDYMLQLYNDTMARLNLPTHGMKLQDFVGACKDTLRTDPYLTMFVLYLRMGPHNVIRSGLFCAYDELLIQDPFHVYEPVKELGRSTGIKRKATYQGLVVFLQKVAKADAYKHMYVKDLYDNILKHYRDKKAEKYDPIDDFLNINIDDDWHGTKNAKLRLEITKKLGLGYWSSFFDVYTHYSLIFSDEAIRQGGNTPTRRRSRESLNNMQNTIETRMKVSDELAPIKQFLQECEGCATRTDDPLVDMIMEHSGLQDANVINTFRKYLSETTQDYLIYDDMRKNLEIWQQQIRMVKRKHRTFAEDLAYKVWTTRYWDETGYKSGE